MQSSKYIYTCTYTPKVSRMADIVHNTKILSNKVSEPGGKNNSVFLCKTTGNFHVLSFIHPFIPNFSQCWIEDGGKMEAMMSIYVISCWRERERMVAISAESKREGGEKEAGWDKCIDKFSCLTTGWSHSPTSVVPTLYWPEIYFSTDQVVEGYHMIIFNINLILISIFIISWNNLIII